LRTTADPDEQRHATWFGLSFDLVFVAAVSQLGRALTMNPSGAALARYCGPVCVAVVCAWVLDTPHANRFDADDLSFRLAKSGTMLAIAAIAAIAVNLHHAMNGRGGTIGFAAGYVPLRGVTYGVVCPRAAPGHRPGSRAHGHHIVGYSATTGFWLVSIFVPKSFRYAPWAVAMAIDLAIPMRAWAVLKEHTVILSPSPSASARSSSLCLANLSSRWPRSSSRSKRGWSPASVS